MGGRRRGSDWLSCSGEGCGLGVGLRGWLRSSDIGCGFEDAGPAAGNLLSRAEPSVVRGGALASPAGREFEIAYVDAESGGDAGAYRRVVGAVRGVHAGARVSVLQGAAQSCRPLVDGHDRIPCRV